MKILIALLLVVALATPLAAATADKQPQGATGEAAQGAAKDAGKDDQKPADKEAAGEKDDPGEFSCPYYKVRLPEGWKAVMPPTERQGNINAIFASKDDRCLVTPIVGPRGGADAQMIASMFAEQFKAGKPPVGKSGQYLFSYEQTDAGTGKSKTVNACVATQGDVFMVTTWSGDQKEILKFLKNAMSSENYPDLLPK